MLIKRTILSSIKKALDGDKRVIILYGPRQVGKTTLINMLLSELNTANLILNGDDLRTQELLGRQDLDRFKKLIGENKLIIIDEAQRINNIGLSLKLIFDNIPVFIIASGSSSLDLANKINEPLTGRSLTFYLYPISVDELSPAPPDTDISSRLDEFLRFGMYPKVLTTPGVEDKQNYLYELISNYLYKDILSFETVRKPKKVIDLLSLIALQIGSEVSIAELSQHLALSKPIVEKYLDLLEKMFIIVNLRGFSRNLRKEIYKMSKYYFWDLGIRNALIRNFNPLSIRTDSGSMFENFCMIERFKALANKRRFANFYFWRTYDQQEIDLIEERDGKLHGYEFKRSDTKKIKPPKDWIDTYKGAGYSVVTPQNFLSFINK
ncbi:MAG: ATP-binding protein [Armatimonadota bacterium]